MWKVETGKDQEPTGVGIGISRLTGLRMHYFCPAALFLVPRNPLVSMPGDVGTPAGRLTEGVSQAA